MEHLDKLADEVHKPRLKKFSREEKFMQNEFMKYLEQI